MSPLTFAPLASRGLIRISGPDASHFLQNLVTCDVEKIDDSKAGFGALLTPQGKILFDFMIFKSGDGYVLDTPRDTLGDLSKRLTFYRLRSKVEIEPLSDDQGIVAVWGGEALPDLPGTSFGDPRLEALGTRHAGPVADIVAALEEAGATRSDENGYTAHRISLAVPEGLTDYAYSDVFPHDADMDQLGGVSFTKGCYVGQEVVARMQHRSTARKRMILVTSASPLPEKGAPIIVDDKSVGTLGSTSSSDGTHVGIALVRLDKAGAARDKGSDFTCGDAQVTLTLPEWAGFGWPDASDNG